MLFFKNKNLQPFPMVSPPLFNKSLERRKIVLLGFLYSLNEPPPLFPPILMRYSPMFQEKHCDINLYIN